MWWRRNHQPELWKDKVGVDVTTHDEPGKLTDAQLAAIAAGKPVPPRPRPGGRKR